MEKNIYKIGKELFITSDEEIKEDEYYLSWQDYFSPPNFVVYVKSSGVNGDGKKIILTTDQDLIKDGVQAIDDTFLKWFVKNPNCKKIEIKTRYLHSYKTGEKFISFSKTPEFSSRNMQCIKIEPRYEIIIPQEDPKQEIDMSKYISGIDPYDTQETLEEAMSKHGYYESDYDKIWREGVHFGAKYQYERMYSKESYADSLNMPRASNACYESKIKELECLIKRMYSEQDMIDFGNKMQLVSDVDFDGNIKFEFNPSEAIKQFKKE
jgi:hypothetical protein